MAYFPPTGSVVAFQGNPSVLQAVVFVSNQQGASVSGAVSVSNLPTTQNVSGSVVSFQGGAWTASVVGNVGQTGTVISSVSGQVTVVSSIAGGIFPISGSVAAVITNTNVNVSGSVVGFQGTNPWIITGSIQGGGGGIQYEENEIDASVTGTAVMFKSNTSSSIVSVVSPSTPLPVVGSVSGSVGIVGNPSISGTVNIGTIPGSVVAFQGGAWTTSVVGNVGQTGTKITSIVSTVPSSVIVGASIFGQLPAGTAPLGSVATLQGTVPWIISSVYGNISGSVVAFQAGTQSSSVYGMRNDAVASFLGADLTVRPIATDSAGRTLTKPFSPEESRVEGYHSVVSTSVTTLVAAAGAGLRNYITDIMISNTGATTTLITFKSAGGASILGYTIAPAGGGSNMIGFATPLRTGANASFDFQPTAASSIIYATVKGFKAP